MGLLTETCHGSPVNLPVPGHKGSGVLANPTATGDALLHRLNATDPPRYPSYHLARPDPLAKVGVKDTLTSTRLLRGSGLLFPGGGGWPGDSEARVGTGMFSFSSFLNALSALTVALYGRGRALARKRGAATSQSSSLTKGLNQARGNGGVPDGALAFNNQLHLSAPGLTGVVVQTLLSVYRPSSGTCTPGVRGPVSPVFLPPVRSEFQPHLAAAARTTRPFGVEGPGSATRLTD